MLITINKQKGTLEFEFFDRYGTCSYSISVDKHGAYEIELTDVYCVLCTDDDCEPYTLTETELEGLYYWAWEELANEGIFEWWQEIEDDWAKYGNNEKY